MFESLTAFGGAGATTPASGREPGPAEARQVDRGIPIEFIYYRVYNLSPTEGRRVRGSTRKARRGAGAAHRWAVMADCDTATEAARRLRTQGPQNEVGRPNKTLGHCSGHASSDTC